MEIPVYLIAGFLESGKTLFIQDTLRDPNFTGREKTLVIACEDGEEEYNQEIMKRCHAEVVMFDGEELTPEFLRECQDKYHPDRVMVECRGMWNLADVVELDLPRDWLIVQMITLVNAQTFENYIANMRPIFMGQLALVDMVIFNRCTAETKKGYFRRNIKVFNRRAQIMYEYAEGEVEPQDDEDDLPYDIKGDVIKIEDEDFGFWYVDALDHIERYLGKTMEFKAQVYKGRGKELPDNAFVPGRFAMTCCADDIAFVGFICRLSKEDNAFIDSVEERDWVFVRAKVGQEKMKLYRGMGPVLQSLGLGHTSPAGEDIVYFT